MSQLFLDVDCSSITYESQPSQTILNAVEKAKAEISDVEELTEVSGSLDRTESANETLANSLLTRIDPKNATAEEIKEAFCRDIDSFSFEMEVKSKYLQDYLIQSYLYIPRPKKYHLRWWMRGQAPRVLTSRGQPAPSRTTATTAPEVGGWSYPRDRFASAGSRRTGPIATTWTPSGSSPAARSTSTPTLTLLGTKSASSLTQTMKGKTD